MGGLAGSKDDWVVALATVATRQGGIGGILIIRVVLAPPAEDPPPRTPDVRSA